MKLEYINKQTGEIINLKDKYNNEMDKATRTGSNIKLSKKQVVSLRKTTSILTGIQVTGGIATGILLGKGLFTGACIALGSAIIYDMITPTDLIYKRVLKIK